MSGDDVTDDVFNSRTIDILMRAGGRPFCTEVIGYAKGASSCSREGGRAPAPA